MGYHYDASRKALFTPAEDAVFFPDGRPGAEPLLCAEMCRLAYIPFERDPGTKAGMEATLQKIGFSLRATFSNGSTQSFLAQDPSAQLFVLTFRGTELDLRDWTTDLNLLLSAWPAGGQVHSGFAGALTPVWEAVSAALATARGRVIFTGHSLGAALATLAATRRAPDVLYTYGSPPIGDLDFVRAAAFLNHHRYINCCDIICRNPPEGLRYCHCGSMVYLNHLGKAHPAAPDRLLARDQLSARLAYLMRWAWRPGTVWTRETADHAPVNYLWALSQSLS
jgi:hypothetical protein